MEHHVPTLSVSILNRTHSLIGTPRRGIQASQTTYSELDESQCYLDETVQDDSEDELIDLLADLITHPDASPQPSDKTVQSSSKDEKEKTQK